MFYIKRSIDHFLFNLRYLFVNIQILYAQGELRKKKGKKPI